MCTVAQDAFKLLRKIILNQCTTCLIYTIVFQTTKQTAYSLILPGATNVFLAI
jgi:hypothetical protein